MRTQAIETSKPIAYGTLEKMLIQEKPKEGNK